MRPGFICSALLLLLVTASSCSNSDQTQQTSPPDTATTAPLEAPDTTGASAVTAQSDTLQVVRQRHEFSTPGQKDLFLLTMRGDSLLKGEATFTITQPNGQVIFREVFQAADLEASLVYELTTPTATQVQREAFVRRRVEEFFTERNFRRPAIKAGETYPAGVIEQATWDDLRKRSDATGFQYLLGKEDGRRIAWSPLTKQVVRYGSFGG